MTITENPYDPGQGYPVGYIGPELVETSPQQKERGIEINDKMLDDLGIREISSKDEQKALELLKLIGITKMILNGDKPEQK